MVTCLSLGGPHNPGKWGPRVHVFGARFSHDTGLYILRPKNPEYESRGADGARAIKRFQSRFKDVSGIGTSYLACSVHRRQILKLWKQEATQDRSDWISCEYRAARGLSFHIGK